MTKQRAQLLEEMRGLKNKGWELGPVTYKYTDVMEEYGINEARAHGSCRRKYVSFTQEEFTAYENNTT
jgi:hypothetical protein